MIPRAARTLFATGVIAAAVLLASCGEDPPVEPETVLTTDLYPTWSPIADTIAFFRSRATSEGPMGIYVVGSDGGTPHLVSPGEFHELQYAPDGRTFASVVNGNLITIFAPTDTRRLVLTSGGGIFNPDWSPDGTSIVYGRGSGSVGSPDSTGIHIVNVVTGLDDAMRDTLGAPIQGYQPTWSPEDTLIAYSWDRAIDVWNTRTRVVTRLITPPASFAETNPIWIDGGRRLLAAETGPFSRTVVVDVATKQVSAWPIYLGPHRAVAPGDTAFVYRDVDSVQTSPPVYVFYRRGLTDVAGTTIRQLTYYRP